MIRSDTQGRRALGLFAALAPLVIALSPGCTCADAPPKADASASGDKAPIDAHLHLTGTDVVPDLLAVLDRRGIGRAVVLSTPDVTAGRGGQGLDGYRAGNEAVLRAAAENAGRFVPFVTLDLARDTPEYLDDLLRRGACGVKLYDGHHLFHERRLDDAAHRPLFAMIEARRVPLLLHVNTARYRDELSGLLGAFPKLAAVCAHLCGSRTDLDRFESIRDAFPDLLFDTSHGSAEPATQGFAYLEKERARFRAILEKTPERFLFGSDLVTAKAGPTWKEEWDLQVRANLGLLRDASFEFWKKGEQGQLELGQYQGQALPAELLDKVLAGNARRWLGRCLEPR
ncbi:amidohydrolase family protein [Polyangium aurulentum]|uniref:amidohydrolase family protein n=1 Tax=Polyangium aurulentum TaxID=2567896 RepID=UPI00146D3709|nr:amidohydrolase family protein [Polyangium aurulentum]UQA57661.1 amidohydrolase [Polyangium aurulentum]